MCDVWLFFLLFVIIAIIITSFYILFAYFKKIKLQDAGTSGFENSKKFSQEIKDELEQHDSRIRGTLVFWKNKAAFYGRLFNCTILWSIFSSIIVPILIQFNDNSIYSKLKITLLSLPTAILIAITKSFKAEELYKSFRMSESAFYDIRRRLLDSPSSFGENEKKQVENYYKEVEKIRQDARKAEIKNFPSISGM